jgi:hypothetical protein
MLYYLTILWLNIIGHSIITFTIQKYNKNIYYHAFEVCFYKKNIIKLIKKSIKIVMIEDPCFRVLLPLLLNLFFENNIKLISCIIFSLGHILNYTENLNFIKLMPFQLINTFILSYYILHEVNPFQSLFFHQINNILIILTMHILYKYFPNNYDDINHNIKKIIKKSNIL